MAMDQQWGSDQVHDAGEAAGQRARSSDHAVANGSISRDSLPSPRADDIAGLLAAMIAAMIAGDEEPCRALLLPFDPDRGASRIRPALLQVALANEPDLSAISPAIQDGIRRLRERMTQLARQSGMADPGHLAARLVTLWEGVTLSAKWDAGQDAARGLLAAHGVGRTSEPGEPGLSDAEVKSLRLAVARFRAVFDGAPTCIQLLDTQGRTLLVNRTWELTYGPPPPGYDQYSLLDDARIAQSGTLPLLRRGLAGESVALPPAYVEPTPENPGQVGFWADGYLFPIRSPDGELHEIVLMHRNITAHKEAEKLARGHAEALQKTLGALAAEPDLDKILGQVLEALAEQLGADSAGLWLARESDGELRMHLDYESGTLLTAESSAHPGFREPIDIPPRRREIDPHGAIRHERYSIFEDVSLAPWPPSYHDYLVSEGIRSLLGLQLFLGEERVGLISIRNRQTRRFRAEEIELAKSLAGLVTLAIQLTRLAGEARENAVLQERNRVAREIHDTLAQGLAGIVIQLEAGDDARVSAPDRAWDHVDRAREQARRSLAEARRSVRSLRPRELERKDLPQALAELAAELDASHPPSVRFEPTGRRKPLRPDVEDELFRIAREAITNAIKHASASLIQVDLKFLDDSVSLFVEDDGQGFDMREVEDGQGFGLVGIRERTSRLGGRFHLGPGSSGRGGTRVEIEVPDA